MFLTDLSFKKEFNEEFDRVISMDFSKEEDIQELLSNPKISAQAKEYVLRDLEYATLVILYGFVLTYGEKATDFDVNEVIKECGFELGSELLPDEIYASLKQLQPSYALDALTTVNCSDVAFREDIRKAFVNNDQEAFRNLFRQRGIYGDYSYLDHLCQFYNFFNPKLINNNIYKLLDDILSNCSLADYADTKLQALTHSDLHQFKYAGILSEDTSDEELSNYIETASLERTELIHTCYVRMAAYIMHSKEIFSSDQFEQVISCLRAPHLIQWYEEAVNLEREMTQEERGVSCPIITNTDDEYNTIVQIYIEAGNQQHSGNAKYTGMNRSHLQAVTMALIDLHRLSRYCFFDSDQVNELIRWLNMSDINAGILPTTVSDFKEGLIEPDCRNPATRKRVISYFDKLKSSGVNEL